MQYSISGADCPSCVKSIQQTAQRIQGIEEVEVNIAQGMLTVAGDFDETVLKQRLAAIGHTINLPAAEAPIQAQRGGLLGFALYLWSRTESRLLLTGVVLIGLSLLTGLFALPTLTQTTLLVAALAIAAWPIARSGINTLIFARSWSINLLMTVAALGAVVIGEYLEAATVIILFGIGEALEGYTAERSRASIRSLLDLAPPRAIRLVGNQQHTVNVHELHVGDIVLVQPGERIPVDGTIIKGISGVNQAPITGESVPVAKQPGASVWAGTINGDAALQIEVTTVGADTTLQRIIQLVERAQERRSITQRTIERFAQWYTPTIMLGAMLVASVPPLVFGAAFWDSANGHGWLYRALALLVIACPCALVISAPVTIISGMTAAARRGVLIKGGRVLETLSTIKIFAFDKTGTLTYGEPKVVASQALSCNGVACSACDDILALAASVERQSAHPLARAITAEAEQRQLHTMYAPAENVITLVGQGVQGMIGNRNISIGNHSWVEHIQPHPTSVCELVHDQEAAGHTTVLLTDDNGVQGLIAVADTVREQSLHAIRQLSELGLRSVMLTGDNPIVAQAIAEQVGVTDVRASLLPADKLAAIEELQHQGPVAMVGDGINDTPALAAANVGIAIGGAGSAQAAETADVVLMASHLEQLPIMIKIAQRVRQLVRQNIGLSIVTKLIFVTLALFGMTSLWLAIIADVGMTLLVTLNGMRPLHEWPAQVK